MKTVALALVAFSSIGAAANAQPILVDANAVPTSHVYVADLKLDGASGRSTAERRIRGAAADLCANDGDRNIVSLLAAHDCFRAAVDGGKRQLDVVSTGTL